MTLSDILDRAVRGRTSGKLSLGNGITIARTEWIRSRRTVGLSGVAQSALLAGLIGLSIGCAVGGFLLGFAIENETVTMPINQLQAATTIVFSFFLWGFANRMPTQLTDVERDHLFQAVDVRTIAFGKILFIFGRVGFPFILPAIGFAIGFGLVTRTLVTVVTIPIAVFGLIALALHVSGCLALLAHRLQNDYRIKGFLIILAISGGLVVWFGLFNASISNALRAEWLQRVPSAWFVDLALLGWITDSPTIGRAAGAGTLTVLVVSMTVPLTSLAASVWEHDPHRSTSTHKRVEYSHPLIGDGLSYRLFGSHVSGSTLTIVRKRWLQERRTPYTLLLVGGYLVPIPLTLVFFASVSVDGMILLAPVLAAYFVAAGTALGFGLNPLAAEYPGLPSTLTAISGTKFVRGTILSGFAIGAPITVVTSFVLGAIGPVGLGETLLLIAFGPVICFCFLAIGVAMGMDVPYGRFSRISVPLTNITVYGEQGLTSLARMGAFLLLTSVVLTPAVVGYGPGVADAIAPALNAPVAAVRIGSLAATVVVAGLVSWFSYRHAVTAYNRYELR